MGRLISEEEKLANRMRRIMRDAEQRGVVVVADTTNYGAVRFVAKEDFDPEWAAEGGVKVDVHEACGGGLSRAYSCDR